MAYPSTMPGSARSGDYVVPCPRVTDAVGLLLRRSFDAPRSPREFETLLHRLDRID